MPRTVVRTFRDGKGNVPIKDWLEHLEKAEPRAYKKCLQRILALAEFGFDLRRPIADLLRDGIYELRAKVGTVNYRLLYFFIAKNVACLSHGFTKEGEVPEAEIETAIQRKTLVERARNKFTAEWEIED